MTQGFSRIADLLSDKSWDKSRASNFPFTARNYLIFPTIVNFRCEKYPGMYLLIGTLAQSRENGDHPGMSRTLHPMNKLVGKKVRERRLLLGMSQRQLADAMGLTFQQIQRYENGSHRIDVAALAGLSEVLAVPPRWFLAEFADDIPAEPRPLDDMIRREVMTLIRHFNRIADPDRRGRLIELFQSIADAGAGARTRRTRAAPAERTLPDGRPKRHAAPAAS